MKYLHQRRIGHRTGVMRALWLVLLLCLAALRCAHASAFGDMEDLEAIKDALKHSDRSLEALQLLLYNGSDATTLTAASSSSSVAPISTTENLLSTSENPLSTSKSPVSTSESTVSTSLSSVSSSESSLSTSESPVSTSESPVLTSQSSVSTSESSVSTSESPESTSVSSVSTSESPVSTTESPVSTSESPVSTSESPVSTSQSSVSTSESPVSTSESPVSTSESPVSTSESPVSTSESPVSTSESPVSTSESPVPTSESLASTSESPVSTSESPVSTSQSPVSTSESPGSTSESSASTSESSISTTSSLTSSSGSPISTTESISSTNQPTEPTTTTETISSTNEITAGESTNVETTTDKATASSIATTDAVTTEAVTDSTLASEATEPSLTMESTTTNGATQESSTAFVSTTKSTSPTTETVTTIEGTAEQATTPQSTTEPTMPSEATTVDSINELSRSIGPVSDELSEDSAMRHRLTSESSVPDLQGASQAFEPQIRSSSVTPEPEEIPDVTLSTIVIGTESVYATDAQPLASVTNSVSLAPFDDEISYSIQNSRSAIHGNPTSPNQNSVTHDTRESTENILDIESQENSNMSEVSSGSQQISHIPTAVEEQPTRRHVINQGAFTTEISETWTPQVGELRQHTNSSENNEVYQNKRTTTRLKNGHDSIQSRRLLGFPLTNDKVGTNPPVKVLFSRTQAKINNFLNKENFEHPIELEIDIDESKIGTNRKFDTEIISSEQGWIPKNNMESDIFSVPVNDNKEYKESLRLHRVEKFKIPISDDEDDVGFIMKDVMNEDHENINIIAEVWDKLRNNFAPENIMKGIKITNLLRFRRESDDSSENRIQKRSTNEEVETSHTADTQAGESSSSRTNTTWADDVTEVLLMMNQLTTEITKGETDNEHAKALDSQADALDKLVEEGSEDPNLIEGTQDDLLLLVENTTQAVNEAVTYVDREIEETQDDVTLLIVLITLVSLVIVSAIVGAVLYFTRPWSGECTSPRKPFGRRSSIGIMDDISMDLKETVTANKYASYSKSNFVNSGAEADPFKVSEARYSAPKTTNLDDETVNFKKKPSDPKLNSIKRIVDEFVDDQEYYGKEGAVVVIKPKQGVKLAQTLQSQNGSFAYDSVRSSVRNHDSMGKSSNKSNSLPKEATTRTQYEGRSLNAPTSHEERRRKSEPYYVNMSTVDLSDED